jgi:transposase-like protein
MTAKHYVGSKYQKEFIADLKTVYKAPSDDKASCELDKLIVKWGQKYPLAVNPWKNHWTHVSIFFKYPENTFEKSFIRPMPWRAFTGNSAR